MNAKQIIALLLSALLLLSVTACKEDAKPEETPAALIGAGVGGSLVSDTAAEPEKDACKVEVYDRFTATQEMYGDECNYAIPAVRVNGKELETVNQIIWSDLYDGIYVPEVEEPLNEYGELNIEVIEYKTACANNVLSIIADCSEYCTDGYFYNVYNILLPEDRLISRSELLAAFDLTEDDFRMTVPDAIGSKLWNNNKEYREWFGDDAELMAEQYQLLLRTASEDNVYDCIPFVSEDGKLSFVGRFYTASGGGEYWHVVPMDYPVSAEYLEAINHALGL